MKFETPKMNIEMFIAEDVITTSGVVSNPDTIQAATNALGSNDVQNEKIFNFVFD